MSPESPVGDRFAEVLGTCRRFLLTIAHAELPGCLRAKGGASDIVQEALASAHRARDQFRGETVAELRAWLRAILLNEASAFRRRYLDTAVRDVAREVEFAREAIADHATPVAELTQRERDRRLSSAVDRLPEAYRSVLLLRVEKGMGFEEIGCATNRTPEAARKMFARALRFLREDAPDLAEGAA